MKKAKNSETALRARRAVRTSAMPPAACVHQNHTCALFSWAFVPGSGMGTSMTREQQRKVREADTALKKEIRLACKRHKYKTVMVMLIKW